MLIFLLTKLLLDLLFVLCLLTTLDDLPVLFLLRFVFFFFFSFDGLSLWMVPFFCFVLILFLLGIPPNVCIFFVVALSLLVVFFDYYYESFKFLFIVDSFHDFQFGALPFLVDLN